MNNYENLHNIIEKINIDSLWIITPHLRGFWSLIYLIEVSEEIFPLPSS